MLILVVEQDHKLSDLISKALRAEHYDVEVAENLEAGWASAINRDFSAILLDFEPLNVESLEFVQKIRSNNQHVPILGLMPRFPNFPTPPESILAADRQITKPLVITELTSKLNALLSNHFPLVGSPLRVGDLEVDPTTKSARRAGQKIDLTPKEFALLDYLANNQGRVLTRSMIVEQVWEQHFEGLTNIVDVYIRHLRAKIDDAFPTKLIKTVRGAGYLLSCEETA